MRTGSAFLPASLLALTLALPAPGWAQEREQALPTPPPAEPAKPAADAKPEEKKDDKPKRFPDFKEVTKDMKAEEGLFTLYRYDANDKERDTEKVLCRIPKALLNEDLLFATSISRGGPLTGFQWNDWLVRWEIIDKQLKLCTPDTRFVTNEKPVGDVIKRTYNERYLASVPIVTMAGGDPVIDLGALLKSDVADLPSLGGNVRPELSRWAKLKVFPDNILIETNLALGAPGSRGGSELGIAYAFQRLPKLGSYKPRIADQRVGYFLTTRVDWSKPAEARETADRYINRWQLEKRDPSLELSPPKRPITFIIEKTVPIQWRRWVKEGIEEWNRAFEKIGFVDAIVVQQQTDDNEFAEYDPEDARYSFFRWIVSGRAFAMGPSRPDPRTGQIVDADIIMDDSFIRAWMANQFDIFTPSSVAQIKGPGFTMYAERFPELVSNLFETGLDSAVNSQAVLTDSIITAATRKLDEHGCRAQSCMHAQGMVQQLALAQYAMIATTTGKKIPERLIGEAIKEVVAHEVGHTLGLRHNFKGSAWLPMDEIKQRRNNTDEATVASVMDYNPLLFFADDDIEKVRHFISPTIGPYDYWAIEYGYKTPGKEDKGEDEMLKAVASRCTKAGNDYGTDEDTLGIFSPDPLTNRYDMSNDPLAWAKARVELADKLVGTVGDWSIKDGEPRYFVTQAFNVLMMERARNFDYVARVIGGQYFNRDQKGDPDARPAFVIVDGDTQRAALKLCCETLLTDGFFNITPELLNQLAPTRWSDWATTPPMRLDYPIHDRLTLMQMMALMDILSPPVLQRIYDAELKSSDPKKMTAAELITTLRDHIWAQLEKTDGSYSDAQPLVSSISRNLQKQYLNLMLAMAQITPGAQMSADLNGMIRFALRELSDRIGATLKKGDGKSKIDFATRAHLTECKSRIDRVLDARFEAR